MMLKRRFDLKQIVAAFCLTFLMFSSTLSRAQTEEVAPTGGGATGGDKPISFGVKAGLNVNMFDNAQPHNGLNLGYTIGALGSYTLSDLLAVQLEVAYFRQGGSLTKFKDDTRFGAAGVPDDFFTHNVTTSKITLHNFDVPLLMKVTLPIGDEVKPKFIIGPSMGLNFGGYQKYSRTGQLGGSGTNSVYITTTGKEKIGGYQNIQFGLTTGIGFEIPVSSYNLLVDARYRYGLSTAKKSYSYIDYAPVSTDLRVNTFSITLGVGF